MERAEIMKKIRVLHFIKKMDRGGAETLVMNIYRNIDREKVQFDFVVSSSDVGHYDNEIYNLGGSIFRVPSPKNVLSLPQYIRAIKEILISHKYHVVHSHVHFFSGIIALIVKLNGISKVITHSHTTNDGQTNNFKRKVYRAVMRYLILENSSYYLGCSELASEHLFGKVDGLKNVQINNGVNIDRLKSTSKNRDIMLNDLGIPRDSYIIGNIGRFVEVKNHHFLLEVFKEILERRENSYLLLVGTGHLQGEIKKKAEFYNIAYNVKILGLREDISEVLNTFDCFILPSLFEGLPTVLVEAQTVGVPCFVSDTVSSESDMGAGIYKAISLRESPSHWAETILNINYSRNNEAFKQVIKKGYSIKETVKQIEKIYLS
jgi:glycosyltransferase EpsF